MFTNRTNHCNLSEEAIEWINGELLGDGCLHSYSIHSARFIYGSKYLEYVKYVSDTLQSFGIERSGKIGKRLNHNYYYCSRCYAELLSIRKHWYPEGKKIIPKDIKLTPITCRQWYIGDGYLKYSHFGRPSITLHTNSFPISGVEWLIKQLTKLGFKATRQKHQNIIHISTHSTKDFLNYIGKCPVSCYQYKWEYFRKIIVSNRIMEQMIYDRKKYFKQYRKDNPEKARMWDKRKYENNKEKILKQRRIYYQNYIGKKEEFFKEEVKL